MNGEAKELARSSICAAVGVTALYLGSILPGARLSILCAASLGTAFTAIRCRARWALGCYAVTGVLALLLLPEKALALMYLLLPGYWGVRRRRGRRGTDRPAVRPAQCLLLRNSRVDARRRIARRIFDL